MGPKTQFKAYLIARGSQWSTAPHQSMCSTGLRLAHGNSVPGHSSWTRKFWEWRACSLRHRVAMVISRWDLMVDMEAKLKKEPRHVSCLVVCHLTVPINSESRSNGWNQPRPRDGSCALVFHENKGWVASWRPDPMTMNNFDLRYACWCMIHAWSMLDLGTFWDHLMAQASSNLIWHVEAWFGWI